jgi:methionyl-tRNA formyltransferase
MDEGLDTGDVLVQRSLPIGTTDTGTELVLRTMDLIPEVLRDALDALESGTPVWRPQNREEQTYFHKRSERDSLLELSWPAEDLERFVRALSAPYPRAFTFYRGERLEVLEAHTSKARFGGTVGRVIVQEGGGAVVCGPNAHRGANRALVITRVRGADGVERAGSDVFARGGYLQLQA